jgi:hypothetical protein
MALATSWTRPDRRIAAHPSVDAFVTYATGVVVGAMIGVALGLAACAALLTYWA